MNNIILVTRPKYDDGTEYLSYYSLLVIKEAEKREVSCKDFEGKSAEISNISKFIKKQDPSLIFVNGHGDETALYGHKDSLLFSMENIELLKGRIVYARACSAGSSFGEKIVENNGGCFIGYRYPFSFWIDSKWSAKPSNDNIARLYLEPSNEIVLSLINGRTCEEANQISKNMMIKNMKKILKLEEKKEPGAMGMLQILWNNFEGQVIHGNSASKFIS